MSMTYISLYSYPSPTPKTQNAPTCTYVRKKKRQEVRCNYKQIVCTLRSIV